MALQEAPWNGIWLSGQELQRAACRSRAKEEPAKSSAKMEQKISNIYTNRQNNGRKRLASTTINSRPVLFQCSLSVLPSHGILKQVADIWEFTVWYWEV